MGAQNARSNETFHPRLLCASQFVGRQLATFYFQLLTSLLRVLSVYANVKPVFALPVTNASQTTLPLIDFDACSPQMSVKASAIVFISGKRRTVSQSQGSLRRIRPSCKARDLARYAIGLRRRALPFACDTDVGRLVSGFQCRLEEVP